jgi:hypothetical protein
MRIPRPRPTVPGENGQSPIVNGRHLAMVLLGLGLMVGCAKGTYLEVRFTGSALFDVQAIRLDLTLMPPNGGATQHSSDIVESKTTFKLPTSMALKLDTESGSLQVDGTLMGIGNLPLATASVTTPIKHEETWTIELTFPGP